MALFEATRKTGRVDKSVISKSKTKQKSVVTIKSGTDILARINQIKATVETNLGKYRDIYQVINAEDALHDYISECIGNGYISIDTETDGLDPLRNTIAGICINSYNQKGSYIPLNHISYITREKASGQLDADFVIREFKRLLDKKVDIDMFNATFDIRVLRHFGLHDIYCTWDGYLGMRILNENEPINKLKPLHNKYCLDGKGDAFTFDDLFKGIPFTMIPYNVGYLYAAHDPVITTEFCDYQRKYLTENTDRQDIKDMYWVFKNIEMPCVSVVADMEDAGVLLDLKYADTLKTKYHKILDEKVHNFQNEYHKYDDKISKFANRNIFDNPININSVPQLQALLYDVIGLQPKDKKSGKLLRSTSEDVLNTINDNAVVKSILEYREFSTLVSTFIDKLPECINPDDGRIHCSFNQYGADTGRFSSKEPNLQNIPSHNKDIRKMFVASAGYVWQSSDFSQQEPKCLAALCRKHGDPQMYNTFMEGKDLYSEIASKAFNVPYEDCLEFYLDENGNKTDETNPEGKERRSRAKSILLGVLYGRGVASIAEQLNCTPDKASEIKESVFKGFPAIKQFEEDSLKMAEELGYVTTVCGRKRRLPDLQLPEYEFKWKDGAPPDDDVLDFDFMNKPEYNTDEVPDDIVDYYLDKLDALQYVKFKQRASAKQKIREEALQEGILIIDNGGKIAEARRQCVNARIQGSAADLTKLAMIYLSRSERLKELGFRMLIQVHDEIIAECPKEHAEECAKILADTMSKAAETILELPIKCDVAVTERWYGDPVIGERVERESNTARQFENELLGHSNNWVTQAQQTRKNNKRRKNDT